MNELTPPKKKAGRPKGSTVPPLPPILKKKPVAKKTSKKTVKKKPAKTAVEKRIYAEHRQVIGRALRKYDWDLARNTYVSSHEEISLKKLSEDMNIPYAQMRIRSSKERWRYQRAEEQKKIFKDKRVKHLQKMADDSIKFDQVAIDTAKVGMSLVAGRLAEMSRMFAASQPGSQAVLEKMQRGEPVTMMEMRSSINYKELRELALAAQAFQDIGRRAFGVDEAGFDIENLTINNGGESVINVQAEIGKDDPARLAAMMEAMERAGLINLNIPEEGGDDGIIDAEVVEEPQKELESGNSGNDDNN